MTPELWVMMDQYLECNNSNYSDLLWLITSLNINRHETGDLLVDSIVT